MVYGGDAIEPSYCEDHVINDFYSEVAARVVHVRHWRPRVRSRVVHLAATHSRDTVETSDYVDLGEENKTYLISL